ncbi:MAG: FmdB family transcriptional regulator [Deltaproteobacteria bacterium]|nr:MAG: FmdB family transcriptional regulator [Deltaproteobacteria bacterium]
MPIYRYTTLPEDSPDAEVFEVHQRLAEPALTRHPNSGLPVRRVITPANLSLKHSGAREKAILDDANLAKHGFARYERAGDGEYVRTAGTKGPDRLSS